MDPRIIYSPKYDIKLLGLSFLHPFDGSKFTKAYKFIEKSMGSGRLSKITVVPEYPAKPETLKLVHSDGYMNSLKSKDVIAKALEVSLINMLSLKTIQSKIENPMKWAVSGTILAAELAFEHKLCFNIGGGFHHAHADKGEGFCLFADIPIAIESLRQKNMLDQSDKVLIIDLDVHRGNGFESIYAQDTSIQFFDMYNFQIYPGLYEDDETRFPYLIPVKSKSTGNDYLDTLKNELPKFIAENSDAKLVFYNAGTDPYAGDKLGSLNLSAEDILDRDKIVLNSMKSANIPTVMVTSGGYSKKSYQLIGRTVEAMLVG